MCLESRAKVLPGTDFKPAVTTIDKFLANARAKVADLDLPEDVTVKFRGSNEDQMKALHS